MKKFIIILFLLTAKMFAQNGWFWQNPFPVGSVLLSTSFQTENKGWIRNGSGILYHTIDGKSWDKVNIISDKEDFSFCHIKFLNDEDGWIYGPNGFLLHTKDGGINWDTISNPLSNSGATLSGLFFINNQGWISAWKDSFNYLLTSEDFGESWKLKWSSTNNDYYLKDIYYTSKDTGWAISSGNVLFTSDGGSNWSIKYSVDRSQYDLKALGFFNNNEGWIGVEGTSNLIHTKDGGLNWEWYNTGLTVSLFDNFRIINANTGFAISQQGVILKTTDKGENWEKCNVQNCNSIIDISFPNEQIGWLIGYYGGLYKSTDGGLNWAEYSKVITSDWTEINIIIFDTKFINENEGYAVGSAGNLYSTEDGGNNWNVKSICSEELHSVVFVSKNQGWASGNNGIILHTSDGGEHWIKQYSKDGGYYRTIVFVDSLNGWAGGREIIHSTDGGESWSIQVADLGTTIGAVNLFFHDLNNGWAVTGNTLLHTTDGGNTWQYYYNFCPYPLTLSNIFFVDKNHGWIVGQYGAIYKTSNGGINWTRKSSGGATDLNSIFFADTLNGWAVGNNGMIIYSRTGGEYWSQQTRLTNNDLTSAYFVNEKKGWAVGRGSTILYTEIGGTTGIKQNSSKELPKEYFLFQNYPNPFNPSTNIEFQIPRNGNVSLELFDILGRKVMTLVDEEKVAGRYNVSFNASNLSSGVYFYTLRTNNFIQTKKMILIR
jgi:photosystem II stability/assembly factor-like uncharacterized protein